MSWSKNPDKSESIVFLVGAAIAVIAIKTEPDGNLLVTTTCFLFGGTFALVAWKLLKKIINL
jgi:hypothetical protein